MDHYTYTGSVNTSDELPESAPFPGAVLRIVAEQRTVMWDGQTWADAPAGIDPYAVTPAGTPYVVGDDVVGQYPEVSHSLADSIDNRNATQDTTTAALRTDHNALNARTAGINRNGQAVEVNSGSAATALQVLSGNAGFSADANTDASPAYGRFWWRHNGVWHQWLLFRWSTTGNNEMFVQSGAEWNLNNPKNFFAGTFFPAAQVQPANLPKAVQTTDAPEGTFDLAATVLELARQVEALTARIAALETP